MAIIETTLGKESRDRYLTYALSVVSGRALPDVRDGLKPVQRRILYAMGHSLNLRPDHSHRKSAAVVGEVLARFHPHGDIACYEAMVRMAQSFSLRYPLVDGQGNFGSLDGDSAAAYRYTEAKLRELAMEVIGDIDEETVDFRDNFDSTLLEPVVLPSRVPNLLINGASGIAVGMATSIPPHNLSDTIDALVELLADPELGDTRLATVIKGPDFPTGCSVLNTKAELNEIYRTGRGAIRMRGDWNVEDLPRGKRAIIITTIPYAVNKAQLVEKIASLIIEKKLPQLVDVRDESTDEVRIFLELASGADPDVALAYLYKNTSLETNFPVNFTVLLPGEKGSIRPEQVSLKQCLQEFLKFRNEVTEKKLKFERKQLLARIHILEGLVKIFDALDEAIKIVRKSEGRADSIKKLIARFKLTEIQAEAVVDMRIYQLSKTNIDEIRAELTAKEERVSEIEKILKSPKKIAELVKKDLERIKEKFGDKRRSKLIRDNAEIEFNEADYVVQEDVYAIVTKDGWIKRIRQNNELSSTRLREGDLITSAHALNTIDSVAFFTNLGSLYVLKVADFPSSSGYGDPIQKVLKFKDGETIVESFSMKAEAGAKGQTQLELPSVAKTESIKDNDKMILLTEKGMGFLFTVTDLLGTKRNGRRAIKVREGDNLRAVCHQKKLLSMFTYNASGLTIELSEIPEREGAAVGVVLMGVRDDDKIVGAISHNEDIKINLTLENEKKKEIATEDVVRGRRALKGNKVIARGQIVSVERL